MRLTSALKKNPDSRVSIARHEHLDQLIARRSPAKYQDELTLAGMTVLSPSPSLNWLCSVYYRNRYYFEDNHQLLGWHRACSVGTGWSALNLFSHPSDSGAI